MWQARSIHSCQAQNEGSIEHTMYGVAWFLRKYLPEQVSERAKQICNAMGLELDWDRFAHDPWAVEEAKADPPASIYAEWWHFKHGDHREPLLAPPGSRANGPAPP